ncbi:MAG TPA: helix-turn-helix transcriptional regulator [Chloroflexota bacterium]|nr:helix-turn-helix transcriptional regulator [Chloroflexota bacterium]
MTGRELLELALERCGTQYELSRRLHRSQTSVSRWFTGDNNLDYESALRLAHLLGKPPRTVLLAFGLDPSLIPEQRQVRAGEQIYPDSYRQLAALLPDGWQEDMRQWNPTEEELARKIIHVAFGQHRGHADPPVELEPVSQAV